ncbi:MAG: hypothetical protein VCF07_16615, partial [Nitrospinota bacterium]
LSWLIGPLLTVFFIGGSLVLGLMTSPDRLIGAKEPPLEFQQPSGLCRHLVQSFTRIVHPGWLNITHIFDHFKMKLTVRGELTL